MSILVALGATAALAVPVTALLCRHQIARKRKVGVPTTLLGTFIPAVCMIVPLYLCATASETSARDHGLPLVYHLFFVAAAVAFIPAVLTVIVYQAQNRDIHNA